MRKWNIEKVPTAAESVKEVIQPVPFPPEGVCVILVITLCLRSLLVKVQIRLLSLVQTLDFRPGFNHRKSNRRF